MDRPRIDELLPHADFIIVTPGIRSAKADPDDQKRTLTVGEAIRKGATYVVIGRPITGADNRVAAAKGLIAEAEEAMASVA